MSSLVKMAAVFCNQVRQRGIYNGLHKQFGDSLQAVHWQSRQNQWDRFAVFAEMLDLRGQSVCDVGCGLGDFLGYLAMQKIGVVYTGYDLVPSFIDSCRSVYDKAIFEVRNILTNPPKQRFDFVVASGVFGFGNKVFFEEMVRLCFDLCDKACAFNVYETQAPGFFKANRQAIVSFCQTLCPAKFVLRDEYLPKDYTIILYKLQPPEISR